MASFLFDSVCFLLKTVVYGLVFEPSIGPCLISLPEQYIKLISTYVIKTWFLVAQ